MSALGETRALYREVKSLVAQASTLPPGPARDCLERQIRQLREAARLCWDAAREEWAADTSEEAQS